MFCAIVSHPADTVVSKLNNTEGGTFASVAKDLGFAGKSIEILGLLRLKRFQILWEKYQILSDILGIWFI